MMFGGGSIELLPGIDVALEARDEEDAGDGLARQWRAARDGGACEAGAGRNPPVRRLLGWLALPISSSTIDEAGSAPVADSRRSLLSAR
jgi:hypothetical protein